MFSSKACCSVLLLLIGITVLLGDGGIPKVVDVVPQV